MREGERELSVEEVLQRIDQLLNVLNMITKDLEEISRSLRTISVPTAAPSGRATAIEDVRVMFPRDLEEMLEFEETEEYIRIKPRRYLGTENFAKIASIIRGAGGEYVSAGRESHFRLPKNGCEKRVGS